uniref:Terminase n=1 Tax=viral metagenome TaxID=1070528 RepID=A0A6M3IG58_9ZZZZ
MSEDQIRQHLDGEFIDFSNAPFSDKAIMNLLQPSLELKEAEEGHFYVTGWDIALKVDFSVGITLDVTTIPFKIVAFQRFSNVGWQVLYDSMRARHNHYRDICYFDATGLAQHIEEHLEDIAPHPIMISKSTGLNSIGKSELLVSLIYGLEQNYIHSPFIKPLIEELRFYRWEDTKLRTDCVIALSMAFLAAKESGFCNKGQYGPNFQATPSVGALSEAGAIAEKFDLRGDR